MSYTTANACAGYEHFYFSLIFGSTGISPNMKKTRNCTCLGEIYPFSSIWGLTWTIPTLGNHAWMQGGRMCLVYMSTHLSLFHQEFIWKESLHKTHINTYGRKTEVACKMMKAEFYCHAISICQSFGNITWMQLWGVDGQLCLQGREAAEIWGSCIISEVI